MKYATVVALALLAAFAMAWHSPAWQAERDAQAARVARVAAARAEADAARVATVAPVRAGVEMAAWLAAGVAAVSGAAWLAVALAADARRRWHTTLPTRDGRLAVPYAVLPAASQRALDLHAARAIATTAHAPPAQLVAPQGQAQVVYESGRDSHARPS